MKSVSKMLASARILFALASDAENYERSVQYTHGRDINHGRVPRCVVADPHQPTGSGASYTHGVGNLGRSDERRFYMQPADIASEICCRRSVTVSLW